MPREYTTDLHLHDDAFVIVVTLPEYRLRSIFSFSMTKNETKPQILVEIDGSYSTPSRNTSVSLCVILRAQHLVQMTNHLARCDFSERDLKGQYLCKMVPN